MLSVCIQSLPLVVSNQWALRDPLSRFIWSADWGVPSNFKNISFFVIVKRNIDPPSSIGPDTWHELGQRLSGEFHGLDFSFFLKTWIVFKSCLSLIPTAHFKPIQAFYKWISLCKKAKIVAKGFWQVPGSHFSSRKMTRKKRKKKELFYRSSCNYREQRTHQVMVAHLI